MGNVLTQFLQQKQHTTYKFYSYITTRVNIVTQLTRYNII